jgi:hypothetical protein
MPKFVFSNSHSRCDNPKCKFAKTHFSPCSDKLGYDVQKCENSKCYHEKGHDGMCLYVMDENPGMQFSQYSSPIIGGYNMQYQSLSNDYGGNTNNSNNNHDRRKFIINYVTINNYYGDSRSSGNFSQQEPTNSLGDVINRSGFIPQFSNPSNHMVPYKGNCSSGKCNF